MHEMQDRAEYLTTLRRMVLRVLLPVTAFFVLVSGVAYLRGIPVTDLLRDTSAVLDGPWYAGLFSTLGVALWAVAGALCLLALVAEPKGALRSLLIAGAVVSLMFGADDGFVLHETIKNYVGIPSPVTIGTYGLVTVVLFAPNFRHLVRRPDFGILLLAVGLLAISVVLDAAGEAGIGTIPYHEIVEDMAKFLGIATWATFFAGVSAGAIRGAIRTPEAAGRHAS